MPRVLAAHLREHVGEEVRLAGWLHRQRRLSRVSFLIVRDRSGLGQVVVDDPDEADRLAELPAETVVTVVGTVVAAAGAPGAAELHGPELEIVAQPAERPPLELWRPSLSAQLATRLDLAPLALRHPREQAIFRVSAASIAGFRGALDGLGFTEIETPKIVASATESGANVFAIDYFGRPAYLAQSPQFYKQAMVGVFERVYETGPVFRAEPHDTPRHLSEYVSLDAELGFIADHTDVMQIARDAVAGMVEMVGRRAGDAAARLELQLPRIPRAIPAVHFSDAQGMIAAPPGRISPASRISPPHTNAGWGNGRFGSTARSSSS
jgi:nondiscriminating aspartyl-tRNA synthetase